MPLDSDCDFDVFVSYAHADNGIPIGTSATQGWVTALAANLNEGPNVFKKRFFIDHRLKPGDNFDHDLVQHVQRSRLLLLLLSQNYIDSAWCGKEVETFLRVQAARSAQLSDIYVVELFPFERLVRVPPAIQEIRKKLIHSKFWLQAVNASSPSLAGYPTAQESGPEGQAHYWKVLNELRVTLDTRLRDHPAPQPVATAPAAAPAAVPAAAAAPEALGTVVLADCTDDLEAQRNAVSLALKAEGLVVLPDGDYIGLSAAEFDTAIGADLARASLFVQLLSPTPGRKPRDLEAPLPQLQYRRARAAGLPMLQWCAQLPQEGGIADAGHAALFSTDSLRLGSLSDFAGSVVEQLRRQKAQREQALAAEAAARLAPKPRVPKRMIFVDDAGCDAATAQRLRDIMRQHNCAIMSLPQGAPLRPDAAHVSDTLSGCKAGITVYADQAKFDMTYNRLRFFVQRMFGGETHVERWGVVLHEGTVASVFGIDSDDVVRLDEQALPGFLSAL